MNKKLSFIASLIKPCFSLIDVGSDHALLGINLLLKQKIKYLINVEVNNNPLQAGINNLSKYNLLNQTINIINDGLKNIKTKHDIFKKINQFDYCVIAGMGSNKIIDILKGNEINFEKYILQSSKNPYLLRKYLINHNYEITNEWYVEENHLYYPIFEVNKTKKILQYNLVEIYFGKIEHINNWEIYCQMLLEYKNNLEKIISHSTNVSSKLKEEYSCLVKRIMENDSK